MDTRTNEITILGATGWTATICAEHIAKTFPTNTEWCIAGRSTTKLEALRQNLRDINPDRLEPTVYIIPQLDAKALDPIINDTKVIINGIGPYHCYGTPVVESCARSGTNYVDLSTETAWIAQIIHSYHKVAEQSGAMIIPAISGSSSPSDLVAWLIASYLHQHGLPAASEVVCSGKLNMLGMQGGSLHTVLDVAETYGIGGWLTADTSVLSPTKHVAKQRKEVMGYRYDSHLGHLATSFVAWGNESIVQRSAVLDAKLYGQDFVFNEYNPATGFISAVLIHVVTKLGILLLALPWFRSFIREKSFDRGSGPDRTESRKVESGKWKAVGYVGNKPVALARFSYKGALVDMAAILAAEAAASMNDLEKSEASGAVKGGLLTPSTLGSTFVDRLLAVGFEVSVHGLEE
ncbi:hypothetical protein F53441_13064 [Fusarium austroafricanum]|uniref:Saccharopine dehydrogenase NADP binding domain-containing protein n=1 Tax=Fusarium austroafricanum TaxID=2364996 RepID=A0A8H4NT22_9HYPO|nr:hypothetical protein F53441_13064 [Fusarium austroafricanum]